MRRITGEATGISRNARTYFKKHTYLFKENKMKPNTTELEKLAQRVQEGDQAAKMQLKNTLEPSLLRIVRRVLERGRADTNLERKILTAARRLAPGALSGSKDPRTAPLAQNLCQMVVNRLWPGGTLSSWHTTLTA
jgi:hypothetical protein